MGWATRAPVAQTLQSVRQTCPCTTATCPYRFARFPSCGIFTPTRTIPENNKWKQQGVGAGETSRTTNYELQGFTGIVRVGVKIPQDGNRANRYEHVAVAVGMFGARFAVFV